MKLLLVNDDGWQAEGIQILYEKLKKHHDVAICAPYGNRSAVSNCFTLEKPIEIEKHGENIFSCSGFPTDCVMAGLFGNFLPFVPDAVVSGINRGGNMGTDTLYSGTASAARQAVISGVPAVAFSLEDTNWKNFKYDALAEFAAKNIEKLASFSEPRNGGATENGIYVNVNALSADSYKGVRVAKKILMKEFNYYNMIIKMPDGSIQKPVAGGNRTAQGIEDSDADLCLKGYISVALLYAQQDLAKTVDAGEFIL